MEKHIIHLDMDAFYASVEVLDNPGLEGKPVIVGGTSKRGVVSAASYEARGFGVHSAQPVATAMRLCPHGVYLRPRMKRYKELSDRIFEIFRRFTPLVEPLSLDEAFLDVTASTRLFGGPVEIAVKIKRLVREEIGLSVSAGIGPAKFIAKIASDLEKPDGLTVVPADKVIEFLEPLPISKLWGVGRAAHKALSLLGVETMGDLARISPEILAKKLGRHGRRLHLLTRGIDDREVVPQREIKSMGAEETFLEDVLQKDRTQKELLWLAIRVGRRVRQCGLAGRTVTLKVKYHDFEQITRAKTLARPSDDSREIYKTAVELLEKTAVGRRPVRLLGVSVSQLCLPEEEGQGLLFEEPGGRKKGQELSRALDVISDKYGDQAILPATLLKEE